MIVRVRHPKGILKIEFSTSQIDVLWLYERVASELSSNYPDVDTFWISLDPQEPENSRLIPSKGTVINLSHGQLLYLHLKKASNNAIPGSEKRGTDSLDERLGKMEGKIVKKRDDRLCRHGPTGMCEHCQPLEVTKKEDFIYYLKLMFSRMILIIWNHRE